MCKKKDLRIVVANGQDHPQLDKWSKAEQALQEPGRRDLDCGAGGRNNPMPLSLSKSLAVTGHGHEGAAVYSPDKQTDKDLLEMKPLQAKLWQMSMYSVCILS